MTKYYKQHNENGEIEMLLSYDFEPNISNSRIVEITAEEYETISKEWSAKAKAEAEAAEKEWLEAQRAKARETTQKAKAYDIITGVSE